MTEQEEGKKLVNSMTNYERNQWARAGYPGLKGSNYDLEQLRAFIEKVK